MSSDAIRGVGQQPPAVSKVVREARLVEAQAKITGGAGNLALRARQAEESQRDRDLFDATRQRPSGEQQVVVRAAPSAATGDQKRPPPRSWLDIFKVRRRRRQRQDP